MQSALSLKKHFFTAIEIRPSTDLRSKGEFEAKCELTLAGSKSDARKFQVTLNLTFGRDPDIKAEPHYTGRVEVVGLFSVEDAFKGDPSRLAEVSGASMLYGAARELLCNLTARGPWPMMVLPSWNFATNDGPASPATSGNPAEVKKAGDRAASPAIR